MLDETKHRIRKSLPNLNIAYWEVVKHRMKLQYSNTALIELLPISRLKCAINNEAHVFSPILSTIVSYADSDKREAFS